GIRDRDVTGVQTCALPISSLKRSARTDARGSRLADATGADGRTESGGDRRQIGSLFASRGRLLPLRDGRAARRLFPLTAPATTRPTRFSSSYKDGAAHGAAIHLSHEGPH